MRAIEEPQILLSREADVLLDRLQCRVKGSSVSEAERLLLQPIPSLVEPLALVVSRKVQRDCLGHAV